MSQNDLRPELRQAREDAAAPARLTVVYVKGHEDQPVAAPCCIDGCQYGTVEATLAARDAALQEAKQALHACQPFMKHPPTCELERLPFNARVNMTAHLCGLSGYNPMTDDCPGCDDPHYRAIECTCGLANVWARLRASLAPQAEP